MVFLFGIAVITSKPSWKTTQTCKPCFCKKNQICVNFLVLPAIFFVKVRKKRNIFNLSCKLSVFYQFCLTITIKSFISLPVYLFS